MSSLAFGWLREFPMYLQLMLVIGAVSTLGFLGARLYLWTLFVAAAFWAFDAPPLYWMIAGAVLAVMNTPPLRQMLVSMPVLKILRALNFMPVISETERIALEAGATWVDGELFSGKPNFKRINKETYRKLTDEEQAFIDGPCEQVCKWFRNGKCRKPRVYRTQCGLTLRKNVFSV